MTSPSNATPVMVGSKALWIAGYDDHLRLRELGLTVRTYGPLSFVEGPMHSVLIDLQERASPTGGYDHTPAERRILRRAVARLKAQGVTP